MGPHAIDRASWDWDEVSRNPFFCPDAEKAAFFEDYLDGIRKQGSSIGAVIEVVAEGVPVGLGAPVYGKLDSDIAAALMGINAVKGVEIGAGFAAATLSGEENADEMRMGNDGRPRFLSNQAGGILGGISTGQPIVARFAVKPTSSILTPRATVDRYGRDAEIATKGRHDPCVGIRAVAGRRGDAGLRARRSLSAPSGPGRRDAALAAAPARNSRDGLRGQRNICNDRLVNPSCASKLTVAAFARGEIVVVADDDDRENEGDLFVAASMCTPEKMAFIIRHTSGIVCAPLSVEEAKRLHLDPMVALERRAARHRLHRLGRRAPRADHRHLGRGAHQHGARARQRQQRRRRFRAPRPRLSAGGEGRRRADALGPYRGLHRSVPARRPARRSACSPSS